MPQHIFTKISSNKLSYLGQTVPEIHLSALPHKKEEESSSQDKTHSMEETIVSQNLCKFKTTT